MFLVKAFLLSMILLLPVSSIATPSETELLNSAVLNAAIQVMRDCYEVKHKVGSDLAKCMTKLFNNMPNPENYRIYLNGDVPGKSTLVIYNGSSGYTVNCEVYAQKILAVSRCYSYQGPARTGDQLLSITPPQ